MVPKPALVTGLVLVVAVLAFAVLAYQTVPMSATQTITWVSTETSYSPYLVIDTPTTTYTRTSVSVSTLTSTGGVVGCLIDEYGCAPPYASVYYSSITFMNTVQSTYETSTTTVIPYGQTLTSSITESSTSLVPASYALGLTDGSFTILAVTVIGILVLLPAWVTLIPRMTYRPKQATYSKTSLAETKTATPQPETSKTMPSPGGDRVTVDRKDFEAFLNESQKLLDRSQALMNRVDRLENENKQLGNELEATKTRLGSIASNITNNTRQANDSLRKARETMSHLTKEPDKRTSK